MSAWTTPSACSTQKSLSTMLWTVPRWVTMVWSQSSPRGLSASIFPSRHWRCYRCRRTWLTSPTTRIPPRPHLLREPWIWPRTGSWHLGCVTPKRSGRRCMCRARRITANMPAGWTHRLAVTSPFWHRFSIWATAFILRSPEPSILPMTRLRCRWSLAPNCVATPTLKSGRRVWRWTIWPGMSCWNRWIWTAWWCMRRWAGALSLADSMCAPHRLSRRLNSSSPSRCWTRKSASSWMPLTADCASMLPPIRWITPICRWHCMRWAPPIPK